MVDRDKVIKGLEEISDYFFSVYYHSEDRKETNRAKDMCDTAEDALALLKEQEQTIEALKEKLRLLEYGNHDCVQDVLMPAT